MADNRLSFPVGTDGSFAASLAGNGASQATIGRGFCSVIVRRDHPRPVRNDPPAVAVKLFNMSKKGRKGAQVCPPVVGVVGGWKLGVGGVD